MKLVQKYTYVSKFRSGITIIQRVCLLLCDGDRHLNRAVYTVSNVADDDANTYIYYTFIILHYTVHISLFACISTTLHAQRALSLLSHSPCRIFAVSVACPCSQSARATTASPAPLPGRVVVGHRSHSSDHHTPCRDKHNCQRRDSNLGPLTPQSDALTTRLLRPASKQRQCMVDVKFARKWRLKRLFKWKMNLT